MGLHSIRTRKLCAAGALFFCCAAQLSSAKYIAHGLGYPDYGLLPAVSKETMELHHGKHYPGYVNNLNSETNGDSTVPLESLQGQLTLQQNEQKKRNNAGGAYNHGLFFSMLAPPKHSMVSDIGADLKSKIEAKWTDFDSFLEALKTKAGGVFGSGWAWLVVKLDGSLDIETTANQDNPLMPNAQGIVSGTIPILGIDVWEHAYYVDYRNKRSDYLDAIAGVLNWKKITEFYDNYAKSLKPVPYSAFSPPAELLSGGATMSVSSAIVAFSLLLSLLR